MSLPECPLPDFAGALNKSADEVGGHEQASVLRVVLVPADPQRPSVRVEHFPELLHAVLVRVVGVNLSKGIGEACITQDALAKSSISESPCKAETARIPTKSNLHERCPRHSQERA